MACLRACDGIATAELSHGRVIPLHRYSAIVSQRDKLLDLLTLALPYIETAAGDPLYKQDGVLALAGKIRAAVQGGAV